jgi:peptide deformylase
MTVLPITYSPDKKLNQKSEKIKDITDEIKTLASNMLDTMYEKNGIGLAAVQVGVLKKLIVIDIPQNDEEDKEENNIYHINFPIIAVNPEIIWSSDEISCYEEGCLSFPEESAEVERPAEIKVKFLDLEGKEHEVHAEGLLATCFQHEIDHTNGITFVDHISRIKKQMILKRMKKKAA